MSIKKARKTLQNKEKFNYDILDKVANSGGKTIEAYMAEHQNDPSAVQLWNYFRSVIDPEFATCGCKMEPFAAPFFQHLCDLFSVYAVFRVLRKYTYIYDLHENFDLSFDVF